MITNKLFSIPQATREFFGGNVSTFAVRRWIAEGIGHPKVRLHATRIGGQYFISPADAEAFIEALRDPSAFARRQKSERVEKAKARLQKAGA